MSAHPTALSVLMVSFNTRERTLTAVRAALAQQVDGGLEVIVVDNGSADGSADALRDSGLEVQVIEARENLGFAAACNLAARRAVGADLLLLNPDTEAKPGAFAALTRFAAGHPAHGLYGGRTLRPDGTTDPSSCWGAPTLWSLACFALGLSTAFRGSTLFDPESLGRWTRDSVREVPIVTGCLLLVPARLWHDLGGMDERFFLYGEDAEFSARARRAGWRPVIVPDAVIVHEVGASTASAGRKMAMVAAGKATLLRTTWSPPAARLGVAALQAGALVRSAGERARRRPGTWTDVWRSRTQWRDGYPAARARLFPAARTHA